MIMFIEGYQIDVTRKDVKRFNLRVRSDGSLAMSVPRRATDASIRIFVRENSVWIEKARTRVEQRMEGRRSLDDYTEADRIALKKRIAERLPLIEAKTGLRANGWTVRKMKTRWGSCNTKTHHLNFSIMLADKPDYLLDYVIVHELVHTKVADHGPAFKVYMDRLMPGWRALQIELRKG